MTYGVEVTPESEKDRARPEEQGEGCQALRINRRSRPEGYRLGGRTPERCGGLLAC